MAFQVHQEPLYRRYHAPWNSWAVFYSIVFAFVLIILPLIIAYNSYDFWLKDDYYLEQPEVAYKYLANFQWYGKNSDGSNLVVQYSTNAYINAAYTNSYTQTRVPILRSAEMDDNRDGKTDRLELSVVLPISADESISGFTAAVYVDVKLHERAKLLFDGVGFVNYEGSTSLQKLAIDGDMMLRQTWPLTAYGGYRRLYENDPLYDVDATTPAQEVFMQNVMQRYNARNVSLVYRRNYEYVEQRGSSFGSDSNTAQTYFNTSLIFRIPLQPITYTPPVSAVLKFAWIQYVSFFLIVGFVLFSINSFIYRHQLIPTYETADVMHQKFD
eukprot:gene30747-37149_t